MKILFVSNTYFPYVGGVVQSILTAKQALEKAGHTVILVSFNFTGEQNSDATCLLIEPLARFSFNDNPYIIPPLMLGRQIKNIIVNFKPDIVHIHHPFLLGPLAVKYARLCAIPVVFTYHSLYEQYAWSYAPIAHEYVKKITIKMVQQFLQSVNKVIAPTPSVRTLIKKQYDLKSNQIAIIPSAIRDCFFTGTVKKESHVPFRLLTVSRFRAEKNLFTLLSLLKKVTVPFEYILAGYGDLQEILQETIDRGFDYGKGRIIIAPDQQKLCTLYAESDLFIFTSKTETQGLVLAESMAAGTPVVAYASSGIRDCVVSGVNGYKVMGEKEFILRIEQLAQDKNLYTTMSQGALDTAQNYATGTMLIQLLALYQELAG